MFRDSNYCSTSHLHRNEGFHYTIIPQDHQLHTTGATSPLTRCCNTYNHEPASSFEIATSTTLEYEKWRDLS